MVEDKGPIRSGTTQRVRLHSRASGSGDPILYVHGFPLTAELWDGVVFGVGDEYLHVTPDLRGHGKSASTPAASMGSYAEDLLAVLDEENIVRPVVLVGMSMGGYVAFELVRRAPERVRALVLANTRVAADTSEQMEVRRNTAARIDEEGVGFLADDMAQKLFSPSASSSLRQTWREIMARTPPEGAAAALLAMAARPDSSATLRQFQHPTLVVAGADDQVIPPSEARAMADLARDARFATLESAGHMAPVEQPGRFASLLAEFVAALPPIR